MAALTITSWLLLALSTLAAAYWSVALWRVLRMTAKPPLVREGLALGEPPAGAGAAWPALSIIVPAHNEERVIERCAEALRAQRYPDFQVIFVLDRCTDRTRDLLAPRAEADNRITIIENDHCPDGWAGKCNVARLGAEAARGGYLIFTDADTQFDPDLARAAVALAAHRNVDLLSLLSTLRTDRPHEQIAQPVAAMNLIRIFPFRRVRPGRRPRPFANGQFMLFRREWYDRIGGHAAVKDDLLEDLALARLTEREGGEVSVFIADGMLRVSMYDSFEAFRSGWKRIFIEACRREPARLRRNAAQVLATGVLFPVAQIAALGLGAAMIALGEAGRGAAIIAAVLIGWAVQGAALLRVYSLSRAPAWAVLCYPLGGWTLGRILLEGASDLAQRRPLRWAGREYILEPRPRRPQQLRRQKPHTAPGGPRAL